MKKIIIFDFDGTLIDSYSLIVDCINQLAPKYGFRTLNPKELKNKPIKEIILELNISKLKLFSFTKNVKKLLESKINETNFFPEIIEIIKTLSKDFQLAIISSSKKEIIDNLLERNNLNKYFDFVYSDSSLFGKSIVIEKAIKKYNLIKENIYYIGDEVRDIEAAKKTKIKSIAVTWGINSKELLVKSNPSYLITKPSEIFAILNKNTQDL
ncbi:MAG: HAD-IA family hydrolase [Nanoarchaeota archaeon]|nr:HAD-IA family hydrolase [Nanoarchaeota archaeon]